MRSRSGHHCRLWMSYISVREALLTSVAWVRSAGQVPQQPAVDGAEQQLAAFGACARAGHVVEDPLDLGAAEIGIDQQAGALAHQFAHSRRPSAVRRCPRSAATARRWRCGSAWPVLRSQTTVVSRWLVMPMPAICEALTCARVIASTMRALHAAQDLARVVFHPARLREQLLEFALGHARPPRRRGRTASPASWWCPGRWRGGRVCPWRPRGESARGRS